MEVWLESGCVKLFCKQIWMILTLDCERSAHLTSESLDRPLNWAETLAVKMHRLICSKSRRLNRQMIELQRAMQAAVADPSVATSKKEQTPSPSKFRQPGLSSAAESRIKSRLRKLDQ